MLTAIANENNTYEIGIPDIQLPTLVCYVFTHQLPSFFSKISILNVFPPVTELCEYAGNVDVPIARESIRAVGKIALQQYDVNAIVDRLLQFLEMDKDYVTAETLVSFATLDDLYSWSCFAGLHCICISDVSD